MLAFHRQPNDRFGVEMEHADAAHIIRHEEVLSIGEYRRRLRRNKIAGIDPLKLAAAAADPVDAAEFSVGDDGIAASVQL